MSETERALLFGGATLGAVALALMAARRRPDLVAAVLEKVKELSKPGDDTLPESVAERMRPSSN